VAARRRRATEPALSTGTPWRYIADDGALAAEGLAADEVLMRGYAGPAGATRPPTLRLYTYRSHAALVGLFQDMAAEIDLEKCNRLGIPVNRRPTGGGAMVMGEGQLGVALMASRHHPDGACRPQELFCRCTTGIIAGLREWGIHAVRRPKNDIEVNGRNIAGAAVALDDQDVLLFHTSLLVDIDYELLAKVLRLVPEKAAGKPGMAPAQRLTSVGAELPAGGRAAKATIDQAREYVRRGFAHSFGAELAEQPFTPRELADTEALARSKYRSYEWINQNAQVIGTSGTAVAQTSGGLLRIYVSLTGNLLKQVVISGDFFGTCSGLARLEAALKWTPAEYCAILRAVKSVYAAVGDDEAQPLVGVSAAELSHVVWRAVIESCDEP